MHHHTGHKIHHQFGHKIHHQIEHKVHHEFGHESITKSATTYIMELSTNCTNQTASQAGPERAPCLPFFHCLSFIYFLPLPPARLAQPLAGRGRSAGLSHLHRSLWAGCGDIIRGRGGRRAQTKAGRAGLGRGSPSHTRGFVRQLPPLIVPSPLAATPDNRHRRWHPTPTSVRLY